MGVTVPSSSKLYVRDVILKLTSGVGAFVMHFAAGVILARVLGAEGNGLVALLILIPTLIAFFSSLGVDKANGYLAGAGKYSPQMLLGNSISLTLTLGLLMGIAYWITMPITLEFLSTDLIDRPLLILAFLLVPLTLLTIYLQGILWGLARIPQLSLVSIVRFSSLLALNIILVWILRWGITGALLAAIATPAICTVLYAFFLRNDVDRLPIGFEKKSLWASLNFGLQAHLGNMFHFLNWRLDLLVVNFFAGAANVGFYVVAATLAELLWYLPDAFGFVLFPKTASSDPETASQFTPKVARLSTFITAVAALGLFLVSRQAISVIYTEEFLPALYPLWILLPGVVALSYSKVIFSDLGGRGKPYYATYASLIAFLVTVVFDFLLIPRWGIIGAAVASSLSYTTNAVLAIAFYVRLTSNRLTDVLFIQKGDVEASYSAGRKMVIAISHSIRA